MHPAKLAASLLVLFAYVLGPAPARAETVNCTPITALPAVITHPGVYCFTGDLITSMPSGSAIDIQANNVVLDLNGFKLGGLGAGTGTTAGRTVPCGPAGQQNWSGGKAPWFGVRLNESRGRRLA